MRCRVFWLCKWATTWQNQQNECAPSEDSDQPGHPHYHPIMFPKIYRKYFTKATSYLWQITVPVLGAPLQTRILKVNKLQNKAARIISVKADGPRQANLVLIAYASSEGSGEPAHPRSLARTSAARSYRQWVKRNLQTESQIPGPSEWLGMRS